MGLHFYRKGSGHYRNHVGWWEVFWQAVAFGWDPTGTRVRSHPFRTATTSSTTTNVSSKRAH